MTPKMETPARRADATGAKIETASSLTAEYADHDCQATPFEQVSIATMRVLHLACRHGLTAERAAMVAPMIFGEGAV